jgi:hypothetical protein
VPRAPTIRAARIRIGAGLTTGSDAPFDMFAHLARPRSHAAGARSALHAKFTLGSFTDHRGSREGT